MNETQRPTNGPWVWSQFCKPDGAPIETVQDVADTVAGSAHHTDRAELFGVTLDDAATHPDGLATVVCYTGNGPNAHNNARVIALVPTLIDFLRRLLARDHGFVYSRDEKDAIAMLRHIDGVSAPGSEATHESASSVDAVDPSDGTQES